MKPRNVVLLSVAGMLLTSATVYSFAPPPQLPAPPTAIHTEATPPVTAAVTPTANPQASFTDGSTLRVEGRLGHPTLGKGASGDTYLMLEIRADDRLSAARPAPSHLALVIDRSGSMKGERLPNALMSAAAAVDHLGDGDVISVIAFDTNTSTVVRATPIDADNRARVKAAIQTIKLGGDTCISCGIEAGMSELEGSFDKVRRMIVLSDGDATHGVRDVIGLRAVALRAYAHGATVSTIGVGIDYNQRLLGAIALEAGGGHYFVENASSLRRVFEAETETLRATVANGAEAAIDLGEGVELDHVIDRAFERRGRKVIVPLGSFARGEVKTVLARVKVPTAAEGARAVASVSVGYQDLVEGRAGRAEGALGLRVADAAGEQELDAIVAGRLARSGTASALLEANQLIAEGRIDEANRVLREQQQELAAAAEKARRAAPAGRAADVDKDFQGQASTLANANAKLIKGAPKPAVQRAVRANQELANPFMK